MGDRWVDFGESGWFQVADVRRVVSDGDGGLYLHALREDGPMLHLRRHPRERLEAVCEAIGFPVPGWVPREGDIVESRGDRWVVVRVRAHGWSMDLRDYRDPFKRKATSALDAYRLIGVPDA